MPHRGKIKVLVVQADSVLRQGMARLLDQHPSVEVVGQAVSGRTAAPKIASYRPDLVLVDLDQSPAEGLELLGNLRQQLPQLRQLVIAPALAQEPLQAAAQLGATDVVRRTAGLTGEALAEQLVAAAVPHMLRLCGRTIERQPSTPSPSPSPSPTSPPTPAVAAAPSVVAKAPPVATVGSPAGGGPRGLAIVGLGVSTGGPKALTQLLPTLPADFPLPIVLVQHMPPKFTASLAGSLDRLCKLRVAEAKDGDRVERGRILIAPGGRHMRVVRTELGDVVRLSDDPPECCCRPSVDYLFRSLAETFGGRTLGIVLTGMGEDGWIGSRLIHQAGGRLLAQDEATSTVFGMPRGPIQEGIATAVALEHMGPTIVQIVRGAQCNGQLPR